MAAVAPDPRRAAAPEPGERLAAASFGVVLASALVLYVVVGHRHYWFFNDEWAFLVGRDGGDLGDLLRPHNEHWATGPIVVYRLLWQAVGLRTYLPYQGLVIALHLTAGVLLRAVMRRSGGGPWTSTAAASMFVLLAGAGWQNIVWAFQITMVGSLVGGLAHLLLSDHDGRFDRRDAAGLALGGLGLLCSGAGVAMTLAVGLAVLLRRGWRMAALHTVPLALGFGWWWLAYARTDHEPTSTSVGWVLDFAGYGLRSAFAGMASPLAARLGLVVVLVAGSGLAWSGRPARARHRQAGMPVALAAGAVAFLAMVAVGRGSGFGRSVAGSERYVHLVVALLTPALAVGAEAIARRWRALTPVLVALFLVGVPANVERLWPDRSPADPMTLVGTDVVGDPDRFRAVARSPYLDQLPATARPFRRSCPIAEAFCIDGPAEVTVGWLRAVRATGRLPGGEVAPADAADAALHLALQVSPTAVAPGGCRPLVPGPRRLQRGDAVTLVGPARLQVVGDGGARSTVRELDAPTGARLEIVAGPITVDLQPGPGNTAQEC